MKQPSFWLLLLASLLCNFSWSGDAHAARLLNMSAANRIPGNYLVVFKRKNDLDLLTDSVVDSIQVAPGIRPLSYLDTERLSQGLVELSHGKLMQVLYGSALNGFEISGINDTLVTTLLQLDPRIDFIEPVMMLPVTGSPQLSAPWHLDRIDQANLPLNQQYAYSTTAPDVDAYVFDTGITVWHDEFTYTCYNGSDPTPYKCTRVGSEGRGATMGFSQDGVVVCVSSSGHSCGYGYNVTVAFNAYPMGYPDTGDTCTSGKAGSHGTYVAGVLGGKTYGVAKGVRLHPYVVVDCAKEGAKTTDVASAIQDATDHLPRLFATGALAHSTVFNISLAGGKSAAIETATTAAINAGVVVVAAAGNDNADACGNSPQDLSTVITVGGANRDDTAWFISTMGGGTDFGPCVSLFAPASEIITSANSSLSATTAPNGVQGTSVAAPAVAGIAAIYLQTHYNATPATVKSVIVQNATPGKITGIGFGPGSPNLLAYSGLPSGTQTAPGGPTVREVQNREFSAVMIDFLSHSP